jgi:hypothetical protein
MRRPPLPCTREEAHRIIAMPKEVSDLPSFRSEMNTKDGAGRGEKKKGWRMTFWTIRDTLRATLFAWDMRILGFDLHPPRPQRGRHGPGDEGYHWDFPDILGLDCARLFIDPQPADLQEALDYVFVAWNVTFAED